MLAVEFKLLSVDVDGIKIRRMAESNVEAYVAEDSVTFLQRIQELCPVVLSLVSHKQAKLLRRADNEVYEPKYVNEEYLSDMKCCLSMQSRVEEAEIRLRESLLKPCKVGREIDVESFKKQTEVLKMVSIHSFNGSLVLVSQATPFNLPEKEGLVTSHTQSCTRSRILERPIRSSLFNMTSLAWI